MPKFIIRMPHYIDGEFINASPEDPKVIEMPEKFIPKDPARQSPHLEPYVGSAPEPEKLGGHFADGPKSHVQSAAQLQSEPAKEKGKRPADKSPI